MHEERSVPMEFKNLHAAGALKQALPDVLHNCPLQPQSTSLANTCISPLLCVVKGHGDGTNKFEQLMICRI
jgi:hypothetical protein